MSTRAGTAGVAVAEAWTAARYGVIGGVAGVLYIGLAIALERSAHVGAQLASAVALTAAAAVAYTGHRRFTFRAKREHRHAVPRFIVVVLLGYGVSFLVITLLVEGHLATYAIATITVAGANAAVSYLCNRLLVFRRRAPEP